jgi:hypothetical protein
MRRIILLFLTGHLLLFSQAGADDRRHLVRPRSPDTPPCAEIEGAGGVGFSADEGEVLVMPRNRPLGVSYTFGLAVISDSELVAVQNTTVLRSFDRGCTWSVQGSLPVGTFPPRLTAAVDGVVYAWSDNRSDLYRIERDAIIKLTSRIESIVGAAVDAHDSTHVRIASSGGSMMTSRDSGATWMYSGSLPPFDRYYRIAFDPKDFDHAIGGMTESGAYVTTDGGATFSHCSGLSDAGGNVNVFNVVISPVDSSVVWLMGLNIDQSNGDWRGRHIFLSNDGGRSFRSVIDASPEVTLINGPLMTPHPADRNVLFFVFGAAYGGYGTDLWRYDTVDGTLELRHHPIDGIDSIEFAPHGSVMYFGIEFLRGIQLKGTTSASARERR